MHLLHCNVKITRRKGLNFICDEDGTPVFTSKTVWDCFTWLLENEIYTFDLCDGDKTIRVMIGRRPLSTTVIGLW